MSDRQSETASEFEPEGPNAQQIEYWNEASGPRWVAMSDVIDAQLLPLGEAAMDRAGIAAGARVLDVGCGCGQTTLALARRAGDAGSALGVDISGPMLALARERAERAGVANARFHQADAQTCRFDPASFDLVFSRFGVMFFASPEAAFSNLLGALAPGGRLCFVAWQPLARNPWMRLPIEAAAKRLPPGDGPPDPFAPGPFAFADDERVAGILAASGFADVRHESLERDLLVGGGASLEKSVAFLAQLGPMGAALREADPALRDAVLGDVLEAVAPYHGEDGVRMPSASWIVTARRPA